MKLQSAFLGLVCGAVFYNYSLARSKTLSWRLRIANATRILPLLLLLALPAVVQAQFTFVTNTGAITVNTTRQ